MTDKEFVQAYIKEDIQVKQSLLEDDLYMNALDRASTLMVNCFKNENKVLIAGNGGSAADAQHFAAELSSVLTQDVVRPGLPAIAITTDSSHMTASANDFGFEGTFERSVQALTNVGDIFIGISTSGNSKNIIKAVNECHRKHGISICLVGGSECELDEISAYVIKIPATVTAHIQEAHTLTYHMLCALVERKMGYRDLNKML